ncbi:MAG: pilus assembly protein PilM [Planctomycetes bacterium]|nr:pilus assembly protein PilM [Planctomycetota bacterium]
MAYGLDVEGSLSILVGLTRKGGAWRLKKAVVLPGFHADPDQKPEIYHGAPLGTTFAALKNMGVKAGRPVTLVPGKDVYYRFVVTATANPKMIEQQVRMEAEEIGGEDASILADFISGADFDYSPAIHVALAREEVVDHYANSLAAAGVETGPLVPGCAALYQAYRVSGDTESEHVQMYANIGDESTDVILVREGVLLYSRSIGIGVDDFITRLLPEYGGDRDAIRQVLFTQLDLRPSVAADNLSGDRGVEAAQEVASRVFQQITSTIMLAKGAMKAPKLDARKIVLCGQGAAIPGLRELMMNRVRKTVEVFDPLRNIEFEGADQRTEETVQSYRPALALAVGLAVLGTDLKAERATFEPAGVRRRREFLHKSLFLYLAAALVIALVLPSYILSRRSLDEAEETLLVRQQGPIGRYVAASNEIAGHEAAQTRSEERFVASELALMPGRVSTEVLTEFSKRRPDTVRISSVELLTDTNNPTNDKNFKPRTLLKFTFFIEKRGGKSPIAVNNDLRDILSNLPGVLKDAEGGVIPGPQQDIDTGLMATQTVVLDLDLGQGVEK